MILSLILDKIGFRIVKLHFAQMKHTIQKVTEMNFRSKPSYIGQIIVSQVFHQYIIQHHRKIWHDSQTAHLDFSTCFFRKITTSHTNGKFLNNRVLYGDE